LGNIQIPPPLYKQPKCTLNNDSNLTVPIIERVSGTIGNM
jgi:hypothetical protein